ncbi:MAG: undecaprenyldiphospho-muramoylpentapeptide beta-N-acetylglucosaminyltransferase [Actinomycetota bacterium]|nr:MAG: undecaprenyldiphospho-muramoylpentapeptide beta-N-acetylglucosaminyltransferase [Actinomycetota bacterium]
MRVVVAGGGTAGHIEPALNLADALRRNDPDTSVTVLGTERGLETTLVPARGYELTVIPPVPLPRKLTADLFSLPARLRQAVAAVRRILDDVGADVLVGFGGYVALPGYLAARRAAVPIVVHEANARPGLANRLGARLTPYVAETVRGSLRGARLVGLPLRPAISGLDRQAEQAAARQFFGLQPERPTLLVMGGSQGAVRLNTAATAAADAFAAAGIQVLHAVGARNELPVAHAAAGSPPYVAVPYLDRMDLAYAAADLALCRAGAMTCAEVAAVGLPAVYVPFPIGNGEQRRNAMPVVQAGGGLLVDDADLTGDWVRDHVVGLIGDPARLRSMAAAAASCGVRDADVRLVDLIGEAAASRSPAEGHR